MVPVLRPVSPSPPGGWVVEVVAGLVVAGPPTVGAGAVVWGTVVSRRVVGVVSSVVTLESSSVVVGCSGSVVVVVDGRVTGGRMVVGASVVGAGSVVVVGSSDWAIARPVSTATAITKVANITAARRIRGRVGNGGRCHQPGAGPLPGLPPPSRHHGAMARLPRRPVALAVMMLALAGACTEDEPASSPTTSTSRSTPMFAGSSVPDRASPAEVERYAVWMVGADDEPVRLGRRIAGNQPVWATLLHLFAGPTATEVGTGVRLETSGFDGVGTVTEEAGSVLVVLLGECEPPDDGPTVAELVAATVREVRPGAVVKIADQQGRTVPPEPGLDSVPPCLAGRQPIAGAGAGQ